MLISLMKKNHHMIRKHWHTVESEITNTQSYKQQTERFLFRQSKTKCKFSADLPLTKKIQTDSYFPWNDEKTNLIIGLLYVLKSMIDCVYCEYCCGCWVFLCNIVFVSALGSPEMGRAKFPFIVKIYLLKHDWQSLVGKEWNNSRDRTPTFYQFH